MRLVKGRRASDIPAAYSAISTAASSVSDNLRSRMARVVQPLALKVSINSDENQWVTLRLDEGSTEFQSQSSCCTRDHANLAVISFAIRFKSRPLCLTLPCMEKDGIAIGADERDAMKEN
jgi:hypothetical protein